MPSHRLPPWAAYPSTLQGILTATVPTHPPNPLRLRRAIRGRNHLLGCRRANVGMAAVLLTAWPQPGFPASRNCLVLVFKLKTVTVAERPRSVPAIWPVLCGSYYRFNLSSLVR